MREGWRLDRWYAARSTSSKRQSGSTGTSAPCESSCRHNRRHFGNTHPRNSRTHHTGVIVDAQPEFCRHTFGTTAVRQFPDGLVEPRSETEKPVARQMCRFIENRCAGDVRRRGHKEMPVGQEPAKHQTAGRLRPDPQRDVHFVLHQVQVPIGHEHLDGDFRVPLEEPFDQRHKQDVGQARGRRESKCPGHFDLTLRKGRLRIIERGDNLSVQPPTKNGTYR